MKINMPPPLSQQPDCATRDEDSARTERDRGVAGGARLLGLSEQLRFGMCDEKLRTAHRQVVSIAIQEIGPRRASVAHGQATSLVAKKTENRHVLNIFRSRQGGHGRVEEPKLVRYCSQSLRDLLRTTPCHESEKVNGQGCRPYGSGSEDDDPPDSLIFQPTNGLGYYVDDVIRSHTGL